MRPATLVLTALLALGLAYRLWPTVAGMPWLANFFLTEDGYLMLTVARNMAIGLGMSVSDGTIPTNGVQPMIAFLFAVPYMLTGGDKVTSLIGVHLIHAVTALAVVFAVRAFAARLFSPRDPEPIWPWSVAILWFFGPLLLRHSMNGLETSLSTFFVVATLLVFASVLDKGDRATLRARLAVGVMCGLAVLARNDTVFLVTALFLVWMIWELAVHRSGMAAMLARLVPPGLLSIAVASPWLINNQIRFGSIVPVSGTAQSFAAEFGQNAGLLPAKIFEFLFPMLPIPSGIERDPVIAAIAGVAAIVTLGIFCWRIVRHGSPVARALTAVYLLFGAGLAVYYGFFFGAPHFLSRYLAPLAPLLIVAGLSAALDVGRLLWRSRPDMLARWGYVVGGFALSAALLIRALLPGVTLQGHEQVISWVDRNVPEDVWVGAVQTGTLGYWHDRTYNLDGKVNPAALAARREEGHVLRYVTQSEIDYIVDWEGVGAWVDFDVAQDSGFADAFEVVLRDKEADLAVLKRSTPR